MNLFLSMLSENDMKELRGMMREVIQENNEVFGSILKRKIRDEVHSLIKASEAGLIRHMDQMEERMLDAIGSMMDVQIEPRFQEHDAEIRKIKHHLKLA